MLPPDEFIAAIRAAGGNPPLTLTPGINRYRREDKCGGKPCWCVLFGDGMGGVFGDYSQNFKKNWQAPAVERYSPEEHQRFKQQVDAAQQAAEVEIEARHKEAAADAAELLSAMQPSTSSQYAKRKHITLPDDVRYLDTGIVLDETEYPPGADIVPVSNKGKLAGFQLIYPNGDKINQPGCQMNGGYYSCGEIVDTMVITEGVADALSVHYCTDLPTVCAFCAGNMERVARYFREQYPQASIIIAADNDKNDGRNNIGVQAAERAAKAVTGTIAIPVLNGKECDFNDVHVHSGPAAVKAIFESDNKPRIVACNIEELLSMDLKPRKMLLHPVVSEKGLVLMYSKRGVGKTHVALGMAWALATGGEFLGWHAKSPCNVAYIDGEMPAVSMQNRLAHTLEILGRGQLDTFERFRFISHDLQEDGLPDLATLEGQEAFWPLIEDRDVIIVDNISTLCRALKENDGDDWRLMQEWLLRMRARGKSVILIHHAGKGGQQRGTSRREDVLDTVIALRHSADYDYEEGAKFEVHFEKARNSYGEDTQPFVAHLQETAPDKFQWQTTPLVESNYEKVIELSDDGLSQTEIALELQINKSTVSRALKRAKEEGRATKPAAGKFSQSRKGGLA